MMTDNNFYLSLFDDFLKTNNDKNKKILWKLQSIVKIMETSDNLFCENGLRMIMILFNSFQFDACDIESFSYDHSSIQQKEAILPILKKEFI